MPGRAIFCDLLDADGGHGNDDGIRAFQGLVEGGVGCAEELWISEGFAEPTGQVGAGGLEDLEHVVAGDALCKVRGMLHTRSCLLTLRQQHQILDLFASNCHVALDAYRAPNASAGKALMQADINT